MIWRLEEGGLLRPGLNIEWRGRRGAAFVLFWQWRRWLYSCRVRFYVPWRRPRVSFGAGCKFCDTRRGVTCRACADDQLARVSAHPA